MSSSNFWARILFFDTTPRLILLIQSPWRVFDLRLIGRWRDCGFALAGFLRSSPSGGRAIPTDIHFVRGYQAHERARTIKSLWTSKT